MTLEQLKAKAYDLLVSLERIQLELQQTNAKIAELNKAEELKQQNK